MAKKKGRPISGILLLNKPQGETSNRILQKCKRMFNASKAGHTGSLDPLATGVLPICFGEATKVSQYLLGADKAYQFTVKFGQSTDSGDSDGKIVASTEVGVIDWREIEDKLETLTGHVKQVPPMYSALHHEGKRLYEYAREGVTVEREARDVYISKLIMLSNNGVDEATFEVHCSKGTYVRVIAEAIGHIAKIGGHVIMLNRIRVGSFTLQQTVNMGSLSELRDNEDFDSMDGLLQPLEIALSDWQRVNLSEEQALKVSNGMRITLTTATEDEHVAIYDHNEKCMGIGAIMPSGELQPNRIFNN